MGRTCSCWMLNCRCITWPVGCKRLMGTGLFPNSKLTTHLHSLSSLRISGAIPLLAPQYLFYIPARRNSTKYCRMNVDSILWLLITDVKLFWYPSWNGGLGYKNLETLFSGHRHDHSEVWHDFLQAVQLSARCNYTNLIKSAFHLFTSLLNRRSHNRPRRPRRWVES